MTTDTVTVKHTWRQEGTIMLRDDERIDDLQRNHYGIIQRKGAFCFGMDAVLLSGFAVVKKGEKVLDLGTGTGIIPILLTAKTEEATLPAWRYRKSLRTWPGGAWHIIIWKARWTLSPAI